MRLVRRIWLVRPVCFGLILGVGRLSREGESFRL